jgi:lipopolysaccharide export system protein LptA
MQKRKDSSFSEEKEAKRLLDALRGAGASTRYATPAGSASHQLIKVFLLLFLQKKKSLLLFPFAFPAVALAQALDLSHGGPVTVTAAGGIDWNQGAQTVTAHDDARAVRGGTTVTADVLIAHYRKKGTGPRVPGAPPPPPPKPAPATGAAPDAGTTPGDTGDNEIYRLEADGHVHIYTATDQAWGDHGTYDIDQAVLVLTGKALKLTTPKDVMTARDAMEYWTQQHMAVGRGDASVTSIDGRRITADTLVGYTVDNNAPAAAGKPGAAPAKPAPAKAEKPGEDPLESSGKLQKVDAFGHVKVQTATEIITGDKGVYVPDTGLARIVGHVHVTRGENQLNGAAAIINMKTGIATMLRSPGTRVQGLVVPNEPSGANGQPAAAVGGGDEDKDKAGAGKGDHEGKDD